MTCHPFSLDAGSTSINIKCEFTKDLFKRIQIQDNGCGFKEVDLARACERFATSKITSYDSLSNLNTFGFRGEALASISQVSILEILSKRSDCIIGCSQRYRDGKPIYPRPEPVACNDGTTVTVHDLFYNNEHRKNSLSGYANEFKKMVELVALYSLDNLDVSFHMTKSYGKDLEIATRAGTTLRDRIATVISSKTSANLLDFNSKDDRLKYSATGVIGDLSSSLPNFRFVFFINRRLVQFTSLYKALEVLYKDKLAKGSCPFVYLSIQVEPSFVDANIHPSKNEVRLINEHDVVSQITTEIETLLDSQKDRQISMSSPLKRPCLDVSFISTPEVQSQAKNNQSFVQSTLDASFGIKSKNDTSLSSSTRPEQKVRVDLGSQRIDEMFQRQKNANHSKPKETPLRSDSPVSSTEEFVFKNGKRMTNLESVRNLRRKIQESRSTELNTMLVNSSYVGSHFKGTPTLFIQYDVNLIQVNLPELTKELFYQLFLYNFGNLHQFKFEQPISIRNFAQIHMAHKDEDNFMYKVESQMNKLIEMSAMMDDYFSVGISSSGQLTAMPEVLEGYMPSWSGLPEFVYDLLFNVNWTEESECFESLARALGKLYMATEESCQFEAPMEELEPEEETVTCENIIASDNGEDNASQISSQDSEESIQPLPPLRDDPSTHKRIIASVLYPALKNKFLPSRDSVEHFVLRTTVPQLYKVFHRC